MASTAFYKRSNFVTHLPVDFLYSPAHFWLARMEANRWRIGFTKFATRMLGEIVELRFEKSAGAEVRGGEIIGSIEGFKAISDIYCCADGTFVGGNGGVASTPETIGKDPYGAGWLYEIDGKPEARCMPLDAYIGLLDTTIDRILEKQKAEHPE